MAGDACSAATVAAGNLEQSLGRYPFRVSNENRDVAWNVGAGKEWGDEIDPSSAEEIRA
jgi:hypothetical protein